MPFSFKMREYVKVHSCQQGIMTISNLMKFFLQCLSEVGVQMLQNSIVFARNSMMTTFSRSNVAATGGRGR